MVAARTPELAYERLAGPTQAIVVGGRRVATLRMLAYYPFDYEWSPDGERIAYSDYIRLFVRRVHAAGPPTRLAAGDADRGGSLSDFAWSPDGRRVAYVADDRLGTVQPDGTGRRDLSSMLKQNGRDVFGSPEGPAWSPDSKQIAFAAYTIPPSARGDTRATWVAQADESRLTQVSATYTACCAAWSRDGGLAYTGDESIRVANRAGEWRYERSAGAARWSSTGLIAADGTGGIHVIRPFVGGELVVPGAQYPAWSPDGPPLAYLKRGSVFVARRDGSEAQALGRGLPPSWSSDGRRIAFLRPGCGRLAGIWTADVATGASRRVAPTGKCMIGLRGGRVAGTPLPDTVEKYWSNPAVVDTGAGDDVIDVDDEEKARDVISCGPGRDRVRADRIDEVAKDCETVVRS